MTVLRIRISATKCDVYDFDDIRNIRKAGAVYVSLLCRASRALNGSSGSEGNVDRADHIKDIGFDTIALRVADAAGRARDRDYTFGENWYDQIDIRINEPDVIRRCRAAGVNLKDAISISHIKRDTARRGSICAFRDRLARHEEYRIGADEVDGRDYAVRG
jgi:hypothetical protein